jgi:hypothetical protein
MKNEEQNLIKPRNSALNICLVICRFIMMPLPFIGLLFTIQCEYAWYERNKKWYLLYQIPMTLLLACLLVVVLKNVI